MCKKRGTGQKEEKIRGDKERGDGVEVERDRIGRVD